MNEFLIVLSVLGCLSIMVYIVYYSIPRENNSNDPCKIVRKCPVCQSMYCINKAAELSKINVCPSCYR